jgi:WD40 repeat protein
VERLSSLNPLRYRDLFDQHGEETEVNVVEFSDDSTFFVSVGDDGRVLLWHTSKAADDKCTPEPIAMDTFVTPDEEGRNQFVWCLAVSPDNQRIFSGSSDHNLLIHDANT